MFNKRLWRGLTALIAAVFIIVLSLSVLAISSESDINQLFGTTSFKVVDLDENSEADTEYYKKKTSSLDVHMEQKLGLIERLVDEGLVLVKNNGALPLKTEKKVTLIGKASRQLVYNGQSGNAAIGNAGNENINLTLNAGIEKSDFSVNPAMWTYYTGNMNAKEPEKTFEQPPANLPSGDNAEYNGAAVVVLSRNAGEGHDAADGYYEPTQTELDLVDYAKTVSEKVIVISNSPSPLALDAFERDDDVDAVIVAGGLGARGAVSLGKLLRGTVNPSGKLIDIYSADSRSSAAYQNSGTYAYTNAESITSSSPNGSGEGNTKYVVQKEGIYIGYKYYETRYEDCVLGKAGASSEKGAYKGATWKYSDEVTYSFGYGQSYTTFKQEITGFKIENGVIKMDVKVTNTGAEAGKDVVQLYAQTPYTEYDITNKVEKASVQLVNFAKTDTLQPSGEQTVSIKMDLYGIASYDANKARAWTVSDDKHYFALGNGAHDALNNILAKKEKTIAHGMDYNGDASLVREWDNDEFITFEDYKFTNEGFTTVNGLFRNNTERDATNLLEFADLNKLIGAGTVTYLSRSDWAGTWPTAQTNLTATDEMKKRLTFDGVYEKGSEDTSAIKYNSGTEYQLSMMMELPYEHESWSLILDQLMIEEMLVSVGKNFGAIDPILGIAFKGTSDNDGVGSGPCVKYKAEFDTGSTPFTGVTKYSAIEAKMYPSQTIEASTFNQELIYELGQSLSEESFYTGMTTTWGPGLNLHRTPYSGRNFEYFSEDATLSYILGAQITAGMQYNGMIAAPKHFAFNDAETDRYGYSVYINEQAARETSLRAFEGSVAVGKAKNVMTALNRLGCDWIGACEPVQNDILRDEWGFDGYTITDNALSPYMYGNAVALGTDKFMLLPNNDRSDQLNKAAVLKDARLFSAVRQATHRILYVYVNSKAMNGVPKNAEIVRVMPWWKATLISIDVVLGIVAAGALAMFVLSGVKQRKAKEA